MSLLWMVSSSVSDKQYFYRPSPMCNFLYFDFFSLPCIEETCPVISHRGKKGRKCGGSMTVEAAVALPMLILFILHLASCLEMLRLHGRLEYALWQTGRELAVYGAAEITDDFPDLAVSYLYVKGRLEQILDREYLDNAPLAHGRQGLNYLSSQYLEEEQCINIVLTYQVRPRITCFPFPYFRMVSRYYGRAWTGYDVGGEERRITYVYVTPDGEVWHSRGDCSYLKPNVSETQRETVWALRNASGERYHPCSRCQDLPMGDTVYLTREGNRYHAVRGCPALLRRVRAVEWQENMPYRPCSRCAVSRSV